MTQRKSQEKFNKELLDETLKRDGAKLNEEYTNLNRDTVIKFICNCGECFERVFRSCVRTAGYYCKGCSKLNKNEKIKKRSIEKYGVEHPTKSEGVKRKIKDANLSEEIKEQKKKTTLKNYGVENPSQSNTIKIKKKKTMLNNYGVEHPSQSKEIQNKIKNTNLEKYGVENPAQSIEVQEKTQKNAKKFKEYKFPSGTIIKVQGFEPLALDELVEQGYTEDEIITERKSVPRIQYEVDEKKRYYFPDIFIEHENRIIEVKSTWTYKCKTDNIEHKKQATIAAGYTYEIWCYDSKKNRVEV